MLEDQHSRAILPKVSYTKHKLCETSAKRRVLWPNMIEKRYIFYIRLHMEDPLRSSLARTRFSLFNLVFSTLLAMESFFTHHLLTSS